MFRAHKHLIIVFSIITLLSCSTPTQVNTNQASAAHTLASSDCGPDYKKDTPAYRSALKEKKDFLSQVDDDLDEVPDYPSRLISLLDKASHCKAAITTAPDGFRIRSLNPNNAYYDTEWDASQEEAVREGLEKGTIKAYYVFNVATTFACCEDPPASSREDYDPIVQINISQVTKCEIASDNEISCD